MLARLRESAALVVYEQSPHLALCDRGVGTEFEQVPVLHVVGNRFMVLPYAPMVRRDECRWSCELVKKMPFLTS